MKPPSLFKPREKFLVLEIMPSGVNGLFLSVNEEHDLVFEKFMRGMDLVKFFKRPWRRATQQAWEGEYIFKDHRKVIAVADPSLATTIPIPVELVREASDAKLAVTVPELENMIAQEMAKIFNKCRAEAAARLGVHELDTMLVGEKARLFKVDGNAVVNPAGFTGKKITLLLELTFTGRELFEKLKQFFNAPEEFYFAESPQSRLTAIARVRKPPINIIGSGALFVLEPAHGKHAYPVLYREPFSWDFSRIFVHITGALGVKEETARELYALYLGGGFSDAGGRAFRKIFEPAIEELLEETGKKKLKGPLYIDAPYGLPFPLPYRHGDAVFEELPFGEVLAGAGFAGGVKGSPLGEHELSRHMLPFLEAYFDRSNTEINQKLRRRLHWLAG